MLQKLDKLLVATREPCVIIFIIFKQSNIIIFQGNCLKRLELFRLWRARARRLGPLTSTSAPSRPDHCA